MTYDDLPALAPFAVAAGGACVVILIDLVRPLGPRASAWLGALVALAAGAVAMSVPGGSAFGGSLRHDGPATFFTVLACATTASALLIGADYSARQHLPAAEVVVLVLFSTAGAVLMASAGDLLVLFLGLELLSLPLYVLTGLLPHASASEGALKYFLLGAAISAVFLYGVALVYAATATISFEGLGLARNAPTANPLYLAGLALVAAGLLFKAALVPFHAWAPDAYAAAPTTVTAFMAVVAKIAAFAALLRIIDASASASGQAVEWRASLAVIAAFTLVVANLAALGQHKVKRLLAYSSIAHAGYLAIAAASGALAGPAVAFYLVVYAALTLASFGTIALLSNDDPSLEDLRGLARRAPLLVIALGVTLVGLTGLPPTAGFIAKLYVFEAAIGAQLLWLVVVGVLASVVSAAYYLRVLVACLQPGDGGAARGRISALGATVVVLAASAVLVAGILPGSLLELARAVVF